MISFAGNLSTDTKIKSNLIGQRIDLSSIVSLDNAARQLVFIGDENIILHFFSSWCSTCKSDHAKILELKKKHNIRVVGIFWQDSPNNIQEWLSSNPNVYDDIGFDPTDRIIVELGIVGVPETFIISKDKVVLFNEKGDLTEQEFLNALHIELAKS